MKSLKIILLLSAFALVAFNYKKYYQIKDVFTNVKTNYNAILAFPKLTFDDPVEITHCGDNRLFVVEQDGKIQVFDNQTNIEKPITFLDIDKQVSSGGEAGLLGLAFHPDYKQNGYFYVNYMRNKPRLQTVISKFKVSSNPNLADANSEVVLLTFDQPYDNHNGGKIAFGADGFLYISTGDGGSWGDPENNSQNRKSLLGKILRIDVNGSNRGNYGIATGNPFVGNQEGFREEIYAYGLRNPWRFSFDTKTQTLWAGDVGQNAVEEIDIITKGGNYGWRIKEANNCYKSGEDCRKATNLIAPVWSYSQGENGRSVTGGLVYRGNKIKGLEGKYIYGDYVSGKIWALEYDGQRTNNELIINQFGSVSAFGTDTNNNLYICEYSKGQIYTIK